MIEKEYLSKGKDKQYGGRPIMKYLLRLRENTKPLQLPVFFFFFSFFCQRHPKYRGIWNKKLFYRPLNS